MYRHRDASSKITGYFLVFFCMVVILALIAVLVNS